MVRPPPEVVAADASAGAKVMKRAIARPMRAAAVVTEGLDF